MPHHYCGKSINNNIEMFVRVNCAYSYKARQCDVCEEFFIFKGTYDKNA